MELATVAPVSRRRLIQLSPWTLRLSAMSLLPQAVLYPGAVIMLKIVTVAIIAMYLTLTVPGGWHLAAVLLAFACLCALTLIDDDASRAVLHLPSLRNGSLAR